jgi:hypothetical protein
VSDFTPATRRLILHRDMDRCAMCGRPQTEPQVHHRQQRSARGPSTPENGITLCLWCHGWVHENIRAAIASGYIVSSWDDPAGKPLTTWRGLIRLLADGTWEFADVESVSGSP